MRHMPTLTEVMTPFPHLIEESTSINDAIRLMMEKQFNHLPVVVDHKVVGLLSTTDIKLAQVPGHRAQNTLSYRSVIFVAAGFT